MTTKLKESGLVRRWSFSRWRDYKECPARFKYRTIDKRPEPQGEASKRGDEIHKLAEDFVKKVRTTVPTQLKKIGGFMKELMKNETYAEVKVGVTRDWKPTEYSYYPSSEMWTGGKIDVVSALSETKILVGDWKSGKVRDGYELQTEYYATIAMCKWEKVEEVETRIYYVDHGKRTPALTYTRDQLPELQKQWEERVAPMLHDKQFLPRPGSYCNWCPHSKWKGGPCQY